MPVPEGKIPPLKSSPGHLQLSRSWAFKQGFGGQEGEQFLVGAEGASVRARWHGHGSQLCLYQLCGLDSHLTS